MLTDSYMNMWTLGVKEGDKARSCYCFSSEIFEPNFF